VKSTIKLLVELKQTPHSMV